jgi:CubicO group peptidase (beta-lactamase class C family)
MPWKGTKLEVIAQPYIKNDSIFHALERQKSFNGIVLIGDSDSILFSKSYGFAQFNPNQNINLNTQFYIASLSKQFTATAILLLAQKNKLKLDQPVNVFIDNFPYTGVTIHHLLSQTSGIPGYIDFFDANWNKSKQANTDDVIEYLKAEQPPLSFIPGAQFEYSNTNYVILAKVIEIISKMSYPAYLEKYIFQPCNLTHTYASSKPYFNTFDANVAFGYVLEDTVPVEIEHCKIKYMDRVNYLSGIQGDGSVVTSINDLFLWHKMLNSNLLLSETSKALMFTPIKLNNQELSHYGYGWYTDGFICDHTGYWPGYQTRIIRNLKTGMIGITFKNVETNNWSWISDFDIHIR